MRPTHTGRTDAYQADESIGPAKKRSPASQRRGLRGRQPLGCCRALSQKAGTASTRSRLTVCKFGVSRLRARDVRWADSASAERAEIVAGIVSRCQR